MRDDVEFESRAVHPVNRQADAVHADRTFFGDIAGQRIRRLNSQPPGTAIGTPFSDYTDAIDVTADQMAAKPGGRGQRFFQIDLQFRV